MSSLGPNDAHLHHCDGSHRWAGGPKNMPLSVWQAMIRSHMQLHQASMGGQMAEVDDREDARRTASTLVERRVARWLARRAAIEKAAEER